MKRIINIAALVFACLFAGQTFGQRPIIGAVDRISGPNGGTVTIQGNNFGVTPGQLAVTFGASRGVVTFASDQLLEVTIPAGATFEKISVTDLSSGLTAYSSESFFPSFGGVHGFTVASLEGQRDFDAETGLFDLCLCDFDGDGRNDVATASDNGTAFALLTNTTASPGFANISFGKIATVLNTRSIHATCGDLNGDGKPDLVLSEGGTIGDRVFIFKNTSSGVGNFSFTSQSIKLTGKKVKRIQIADLDADGKPELVITNQGGNDVNILVNQSSPASIAFVASPVVIAVAGAASTDGLAIDDLNGDGRPEIVTSQFLTSTSNLFILPNTSAPGDITFGTATTLPVSGTVVNIKTGDLDNDQRPDIAVTQLLGSTLSVFLNETVSGDLDFSSPAEFATDEFPWGVDFGDLDGDGKPDIVVASLIKKSITLLNNESTPGNLSFQVSIKPTTYINRHVKIGDIDGDAKPDVAVTSVDDNNNSIPASKISILRNTACLNPKIDPAGPQTICVGFPLRLSSNASSATTYEWKNGSTTVANGPDPFFDVTASGTYTVIAHGEGGTCAVTSNAVTVTVEPGTTTGIANPVSNGPICINSTMTLSVNDVGGTEYRWSGPEGYTGTGLIPAPIPDFQAVNAGRYQVDVVVGSCIAQQVSLVVEAVPLPDFQISTAGATVVCAPDTKVLSVTPNLSSFTYQWYETSTGMISGATGASYTATQSGEYYVEAQYTPNPACSTAESERETITFVAAPQADFSIPASACAGQQIAFVNNSVVDGAIAVTYAWGFGDGDTSNEENPAHQYLSAGTKTINLTVSYSGSCPDVETKNITVQPAPAVVVTNPLNQFTFCEGDSVLLQVSGSFASYLWSTGSTEPLIYAKASGNYSIEVTTGSGCTINGSRTVTMQDAPVVVVTADPSEIAEGQSAQLNASGLESYQWDPAEALSDPGISNPVASPLVTTTYTVTGTGANGCPGEGLIELRVRGGSIYVKLNPSRFFSPDNGDEIGKAWVVENIEDYPGCSVTVYDIKGVRVYDAKPYANDWDGTFNGKPLPDGVYYFIIKCDDDGNPPRTGSITLLR